MKTKKITKDLQKKVLIVSIVLVVATMAFALYKNSGVKVAVKEGELADAAKKKLKNINKKSKAPSLSQTNTPESYWVNVGNENFAKSSVYKMFFDPNTKRPRVVFLEGNQLKIKEFDEGKWSSIGNPGPTLSISDSLMDYNKYSIAQNLKNGKIYFAYIDKDSGYRVTVVEFDGKNWNFLGQKGFSEIFRSVNIAVNPETGEPYVALFNDNSGASYSYMMKYFNGSWIDATTDATGYLYSFLIKGASAGSFKGVLISFNPKTYEPYLSYVSGQSLIIKKYNGEKWIIIGESSLPGFILDYSPVIFDSSGTPHTAYINYGVYPENIVLKYNEDTEKWERIGYTEVLYNSSYNEKIIDLKINPKDNKPYIAFDSVLPKTGNMTAPLNVVKFQKYDGKEWWIDVQGNYAYSYNGDPNSNYFSLIFSPYNNEAYIIYGLDNISVKKFNFSLINDYQAFSDAQKTVEPAIRCLKTSAAYGGTIRLTHLQLSTTLDGNGNSHKGKVGWPRTTDSMCMEQMKADYTDNRPVAGFENKNWPNFGNYPNWGNDQWTIKTSNKRRAFWCPLGWDKNTHPDVVGNYKSEDGPNKCIVNGVDVGCGGDSATGKFCYMLAGLDDKWIWCTEKGCKKEGF